MSGWKDYICEYELEKINNWLLIVLHRSGS